MTTQTKEEGMQLAELNANNKHQGWSDKALDFLTDYAKNNLQFAIEDIRQASSGIIPLPPSLRAWGQITISAKKAGIIQHIGFIQVKNAKAHMANASLWKSNIFEFKLF